MSHPQPLNQMCDQDLVQLPSTERRGSVVATSNSEQTTDCFVSSGRVVVPGLKLLWCQKGRASLCWALNVFGKKLFPQEACRSKQQYRNKNKQQTNKQRHLSVTISLLYMNKKTLHSSSRSGVRPCHSSSRVTCLSASLKPCQLPTQLILHSLGKKWEMTTKPSCRCYSHGCSSP